MVRQARIPNPLMPLRLFKSRNVAGANIVMALLVAGMFAMFFLGALYLQRVLGYDPLEVGLAFLPSTLVMGTISLRYTERLNMRFGARATLLPGIVAIAAGLLLFARTPVDANYVTDVVPPVVLIGLGAGLSFPSLMTLAMSGATQSDAGLASGLVNATVQVGGAIGLAVLATLASDRTDGLLGDGEPIAAALNSGYHVAYLLGTVLVGIAFVVAVTVLRSDAPEQARGRRLGAGRSRARLLGGGVIATREGTREEWLAARVELLERGEGAHAPQRRAGPARRELPWVRIDKEYEFETERRHEDARASSSTGARS